MRILAVIFAFLLFYTFSAGAQQSSTSPSSADLEHQACTVASQVFKDAKNLTPGMTRADVEKLFEVDGGFQVGPGIRYTSKKCSWFLIDVEFKAMDGTKITKVAPTDVVVSVSKVYVEPKHYD